MRRILAVAIVAATASLPLAPAAQARTCGGVVDVQCSGWTCWTDCFPGDCLVWVDALRSGQFQVCLGNPV